MNAIQISDVSIKQNADLFSLNDLHKASGGAEKHRPTFWLRSEQAQELIAEIQAEGKVAVQTSQGGKNRGTFVCKELVYAYATWISAKFFLLVIRTFDAVVSGKLKAADKTTTTERTGLRNAVNLLVSKKGLNYSEAYNLVHQRFNVESIEDLSHCQLNEAVEYIHRVVLNGEVLDKEPKHPPLSEKDFAELCEIVNAYIQLDFKLFKNLREPLKLLNSDLLLDLYRYTSDEMRGRAFKLLQRLNPNPKAFDDWFAKICLTA